MSSDPLYPASADRWSASAALEGGPVKTSATSDEISFPVTAEGKLGHCPADCARLSGSKYSADSDADAEDAPGAGWARCNPGSEDGG